MTRTTDRRHKISRRAFGAGALAAAATLATGSPARAQALPPLKVGVLVPRSGIQAFLGQAMQRGHDVAVPVLQGLGYPTMEMVPGDTESSPDIARSAAERLINAGCSVITGCFDSGQTTAVAQVCEQRKTPFVISIAAAPQITEQGYKYVFRNFPRSPTIVQAAFALQRELYQATGKAPKNVVIMHVNDTYGTSVIQGIDAMYPAQNMSFKIAEKIAYDPRARDLSVEVAKAKATGADVLWAISRINDAILITREMVKQRWEPWGVISSGPGWYEDQYMKTLGKHGDYPISTVPWFDPQKPMAKRMMAAYAAKFPEHQMDTNLAYSFEAMQIIGDAYKRARSTDADAFAAALRATDIKDNVTIGPGVKFDAKGQNDTLGLAAVQNRRGTSKVVLPKAAAETAPVFPVPGWNARG
jgi:branched-chain amino acid transport system substrate-binding protein